MTDTKTTVSMFTSDTQSSALVLGKIWERFQTQYLAKLGTKPSKRQYAKDLGFTEKSLTNWMSDVPDLRRRIPLRCIPILRKALLLSNAEYDALMLARVNELSQREEVMHVARWVAESLCDRDQGEAAVLEAFARQKTMAPRGLYFDAGEEQWMDRFFEKLLARAQTLYQSEAGIDSQVRQDSGITDEQIDDLLRSTTAQLQTIFAEQQKSQQKDPWQRSIFRIAKDEAKQLAATSPQRGRKPKRIKGSVL